jgi:hypothetical protein
MTAIKVGNYDAKVNITELAKLTSKPFTDQTPVQEVTAAVVGLSDAQLQTQGLLTNPDDSQVNFQAFIAQVTNVRQAMAKVAAAQKTLGATFNIPKEGGSLDIPDGVKLEAASLKVDDSKGFTLTETEGKLNIQITDAIKLAKGQNHEISYTIDGVPQKATIGVTLKAENAPAATKLNANLEKDVETPLDKVLPGFSNVTFEGSQITQSTKKVGEKDVPHIKHSSDKDFTVKGKGTKDGKPDVPFELTIKAKAAETSKTWSLWVGGIAAVLGLVGVGAAATSDGSAKPWVTLITGALAALGLKWAVDSYLDKPGDTKPGTTPATKPVTNPT